MKKLLLISSAVAISFSLTGCNTVNNTMNETSRFANSTVGAGVKLTARTVGTGVGFVSNTGAAIGKGVGSVVDTGVGVVGGHHPTSHQTKYRTKTVSHNGHHYMIQNGKYVRMD